MRRICFNEVVTRDGFQNEPTFVPTETKVALIERLRAPAWPIVEGPVMRTGATQKICSVDVRDPDFNLIEISELA